MHGDFMNFNVLVQPVFYSPSSDNIYIYTLSTHKEHYSQTSGVLPSIEHVTFCNALLGVHLTSMRPDSDALLVHSSSNGSAVYYTKHFIEEPLFIDKSCACILQLI